MEHITLSEAESSLSKLIDKTVVSHVPVVISSEKNQAVLLSLEDWNAIQETLYLISIPGMKEAILEGGNTPLSECISLDQLDW